MTYFDQPQNRNVPVFDQEAFTIVPPNLGSAYLAGPMSGLSWEEAGNWRKTASDRLAARGIQTISPVRDEPWWSYMNGGKVEQPEPGEIISNTDPDVLARRSMITNRDRNDLMRADLILANFEGATRVSIGTMIELGWADMLRKPIVAVLDEQHIHPIVLEVVNFQAENLEEALALVVSILRKGL